MITVQGCMEQATQSHNVVPGPAIPRTGPTRAPLTQPPSPSYCTPPGHTSASNASCIDEPLVGTYVGKGSTVVMGMHFNWVTSNTFHANGTHDVDQVPTADPMHVIPTLHCRNVPFTTNLTTCTFHIQRDACMSEALNGLQLLRERGTWEPKDGTLFYELMVTVPRVSAIVMDLSYTLEKDADPDLQLPEAVGQEESRVPNGGAILAANTVAAMASTSLEAAKVIADMAGARIHQLSVDAGQLYETPEDVTTGGAGGQVGHNVSTSQLKS